MWHGLRNDIIMRNVIYGNGAKKLNRKSFARLCRVSFFFFFAQIWRSNRFAGSRTKIRVNRGKF